MMPDKSPLTGLQILVTREQAQAQNLSQLIREQGAHPIECPLIAFGPPDDWRPVDQALSSTTQYDGIFFTSANGVTFFFARMADKNIPTSQLDNIPCYAIGPATASKLTAQGVTVQALPERFQAEGLTDLLSDMDLNGKRFLIPRALRARDILPEFLEKRGAKVDITVLYQTRWALENKPLLKKILTKGNIDYLTFTSSSTVKAFAEMSKQLSSGESWKDIPAACIGEITADTAITLAFSRVLIASQATLPGLIQSMIDDRLSQGT